LALPPKKWDVVSVITMGVIVLLALALVFWYVPFRPPATP
jgi:hypothetical protein